MWFRFVLCVCLSVCLACVWGAAAVAQETGFLSVTSEPDGALITVNGLTVGPAPYLNPFIKTGTYTIEASNGPDYPVQRKTVKIGAVEPVTVVFTFKSGLEGSFVGTKIEEIDTEKKTGSVQVGSVPTGAMVTISGTEAGQAPFGYSDVEVGYYSIVFELDGETLRGGFCIFQDQVAKVVADFASGRMITNTTQNNCGATPSSESVQNEGDVAGASTDISAQVALLQGALRKVGCRAGPSDGVWGRKTRGALERFNTQRQGRCSALEEITASKTTEIDPVVLMRNLEKLKSCDSQICSYEKQEIQSRNTRTISAYCYSWKSKKAGRMIRHNGFDKFANCLTVRQQGGYLSQVTYYIGDNAPSTYRAGRLGNGVSTRLVSDPPNYFKFWFVNGVLMTQHGNKPARAFYLQKAKVRAN